MKQGEAGGSHSPVQYVVHDGMEGTSVPFGGPYTYFQTTSSDGSRVFFLETEHTSDRLHKEQGELYVFDPATGVTTGLTANHLDGEPNANVQNTVVASEDGSYVYFVATGVLAPGGTPGADNFYVLHYSNEHWTTTFIATLSSEDRPDWGPGDTSVNTPSFQLNQLDTRVSLDGQKVAFMSNRPLTGYDNVDAVSGHPDEEVYLYDASDGRLRCVSCNPTGARPLGVLDGGGGRGADSSALLIDGPRAWEEESAPQIVPVDSWVAGVLPAAWHQVGRVSLYQPRYVFDGGRLFFQSTDALVPQDTNGVADVYEYEPVKGPGVPASDDCTASSPTFSQVAGGCVSLISSGQSSSESAFVDASETGDDVFFVTNSKLVGEDYDNVYDMYDAHACGSGWACTSAPVSPPACTSGDSCKPAPSPQPAIFGPTPSETFNGAGNLTPPPRVVLRAKRKPCAKGRVRRHGVCVKSKHKHAKSSRSARKSMVHKGLGGSGR
jgi:dipeptidyl aminopeptidase/acylaminoacyl peptidase